MLPVVHATARWLYALQILFFPQVPLFKKVYLTYGSEERGRERDKAVKLATFNNLQAHLFEAGQHSSATGPVHPITQLFINIAGVLGKESSGVGSSDRLAPSGGELQRGEQIERREFRWHV